MRLSRTLELSERFEQALQLAFRLHRLQTRKGSKIPYVAHLLAVAALVLEDGGSEDEAIAGLLHDAAEDQGGLPVLDQIRRQFGDRVAMIVDGCSDSYEDPKPPWRGRKERYLEHLRAAPAEVRRVSLADKLHNARSILADLKTRGEATWERFNGGKSGTLWYYRALVEIFREISSSAMVAELEEVVIEIETLASKPGPRGT